MSKEFTYDEVVQEKKKAFKQLNRLLEGLLAKSQPSCYKKCALISKWLSQYSNYLMFEDKYDPKRNVRYKRGDVIFANFGFNLGTEFGGNHYAIVLDKESHRNAGSVTVIPLTSLKKDVADIYPRDVFLGSELYEKLDIKFHSNLKSLKERQREYQALLQILVDEKNNLSSNGSNPPVPQLVEKLKKELSTFTADIENTEKIRDELSSMKTGSIAKIEQIRSISKMRIYNPRRSSDPLYGIRISETAMECINSKIKELYIF